MLADYELAELLAKEIEKHYRVISLEANYMYINITWYTKLYISLESDYIYMRLFNTGHYYYSSRVKHAEYLCFDRIVDIIKEMINDSH